MIFNLLGNVGNLIGGKLRVYCKNLREFDQKYA